MNEYQAFLNRKSRIDPATGLKDVPPLNPMLRQDQADIVAWALRRGRAGIYADCGLGKGPMQMEWADKQPHECIIAAPLAVAHQFVREAEKFGIDLAYAKDQASITKRLTVTNFERLDNFHIEQFGAVAIDEASILKNSAGAYCNWMIDAFKNTPFRLCSSATPAPNDVMELGTQAEFLGVMTRGEMLAMYFTHDGCDADVFWQRANAFLSGHGLCYIMVPSFDTDAVLTCCGIGDLWHEISGPSPRGVMHSVVGRNGNIVHDPHPSRAGLMGDPGQWHFGLLVRLNGRAA